MTKNQFSLVAFLLVLFVFIGCGKDAKDTIDEASQALECTEQVQKFDNKNEANPTRPCTEIVADIDDIEKTCSDFLSDAVKDEFAELRSQCEGS